MSSLFYSQLRQFSVERNIPILSSNTENFLRELLNHNKIRNALEIGSAIWFSSMVIADSLEPNGELTTFEISYPHYQEAISHFNAQKYRNIKSYLGNFTAINIENYVNRKLDFVFIDGRKSEYHIYLQKTLPYLAPKHIIVCDDVIKFKNKLTWLYDFLEKNQIDYKIIQLDDDDWILIIQDIAWHKESL